MYIYIYMYVQARRYHCKNAKQERSTDLLVVVCKKNSVKNSEANAATNGLVYLINIARRRDRHRRERHALPRCCTS